MARLKIYKRKDFFKDIIMIVLVILSPLLIYAHLLFPQSDTYENSMFTIYSGYYGDIQTMFWVFLSKFTTVIIFAIWYATNKHWWKPAILISLFISIVQFALSVSEEVQYLDDHYFWLGPVLTLPVIFIVIFISKKLNYYSKSKNLAEDLDIEIKLLFKEASLANKKNFKDTKAEVTKLRLEKDQMSSQDYLTKLIALRDSLN